MKCLLSLMNIQFKSNISPSNYFFEQPEVDFLSLVTYCFEAKIRELKFEGIIYYG